MKKFIVVIVIIVLAVLSFYLLKKQPKFGPGGMVNIDNQSFRLVSYNGATIPDSQKYILSFKDGHLNTRFCNAMDGSYTLDINNNYSIQANLRSTDMACGEPANIMEIEAMFGLILNDGANLSFQTNTITLTGNNPEKTIFVFEKI